MPIPTLPRLPQSPQFLTWQDVDKLIDHLIPQFRPPYDALLMITRGGIVPGGLIAEALDIRYILTAAVEFPADREGRLAWPTFLQFPGDALLRGNLFREAGPEYYAAITDRFIIYPWEVQRGPDLVQAEVPQPN
jgi:hypothetical protein